MTCLTITKKVDTSNLVLLQGHVRQPCAFIKLLLISIKEYVMSYMYVKHDKQYYDIKGNAAISNPLSIKDISLNNIGWS